MMEVNMVNCLKLMVLSCFMACTLFGQAVMLLPQEMLLAGETMTLWGVLAGRRWHDETRKGRSVHMCGNTIVARA